MFCTKCGKMIKDTAKFCPYCGQSTQPEPQMQMQEQAVQPQPQMQEQAVQPQPHTEQSSAPAPKSGKKKGGIVALVLILLLLAAGGAAVWFYLGSREEDTQKDEDRTVKEKVLEEAPDETEEEPEEETGEAPSAEVTEEAEMPEAPDPMEEAQAAYEEGDFSLALRGCDDALREDAGREEAYALKADIYLEQEKPEEAALVLCEGIEATDSESLMDKREELIGRVVTKSCMQYNSQRDLICMVQYDGEGNAIRYTSYGGADVTSIEECSYDAQGRLTDRDYYDGDKKLQWSESYDFDRDGNMVYSIHYNAMGKKEWSDEYVYDDDGNMTRQTRYNADGSRSWWDEYTYESRESVIKTAHPSSGNTVTLKYEFEYDYFGNRTYCAEYSESGDCNYFWRQEYNGFGDVVKYSSEGEINYVYEYVLQ